MRTKGCFILIAAVVISMLTGCRESGKPSVNRDGAMTMLVATDIHYLAKELNDQGEAYQKYIADSDGKLLHYVTDIVDAFAEEITIQKPELLIISGDLTNNGERESHKELAKKLAEIEKTTGTQIYVIPGNHDILNPWARGFLGSKQYVTESISPGEFEKLYADFGYDEAVSRDEASLSYLAAPSEELYLLMLDTNIYEFNELLGSPMTNGQLKPETLEWVRECGRMVKEKNARLLTVMHHNLYHHSKLLNSGFTIDNSDEILRVLEEAEVKLVLSGHVHIQDIKAGAGKQPVYDIVTSALSVNPVQYGVIKYSPGGFQYTTKQVDVEGWAREQGRKDENLLGFKDYAARYFVKSAQAKGFASLTESGVYSGEEVSRMMDTMSLLNRHYFAGTVADIKKEVMGSEGYQLWREADDNVFFKKYVISMAEDSNMNYNKLFVPFAIK